MPESGHYVTMYMTGGPVQVPATIGAVREALPDELREQFVAEIESAPADQLQFTLVRWAMNIPTRTTRPRRNYSGASAPATSPRSPSPKTSTTTSSGAQDELSRRL
ncbi:hypothetical protein ACWD6I_14100 [Streptomyces sp. NPDC002454]